MANYQAARAKLKGSARNAGERAAGLSKKGARKPAMKKAKPKK